MARKIAPELWEALRNGGCGLDGEAFNEEEGVRIEAQARALLAVARAARTVIDEGSSVPQEVADKRLRAALRRLESASGPAKRKQ